MCSQAQVHRPLATGVQGQGCRAYSTVILRGIGSAPLGQRRQGRVARAKYAVKRMIRWKFRRHAAYASHPQPGGDRSRRGRPRPWLHRAHRRDRGREVDPGRSRRAAPRRPRLRRPGPHRHRHRHDRGGVRARRTARGPDPPRDHRGRPQPVVRGRRAGHRRHAPRRVRRTSWSCTASTSTSRCSTRPRISGSSTPTPVSKTPAAGVAALWERVRECRERLASASMDARERQARLELVRFQLGEIDAVKPAAGEDVELEAARRVLANAERVEGLVPLARTTSSTTSERAALTQLGERLEEGRGAGHARSGVRPAPRGPRRR